MDAFEKLDEHLSTRMMAYAKMKKSGVKIVGYSMGGHIPEELIYAAGAVPIGLGDGGDPEPVTESLSMIPRFECTFCKSQIGYWKLNQSPHYRFPDLFTVEICDANAKALADSFSYWAKMDVYRLGIPHERTPMASAYFLKLLNAYKKRLEELTGNQITDEKLKAQFGRLNKRRELLKAISELRIGADPVISSRNFAKIQHASFFADLDVYNSILQELYDELKQKVVKSAKLKKPRVMLIASTLARGDRCIFDIMDKNDGEIVIEEVAEGFQPYANQVSLEGDPMEALVDAYLNKRITGPWDRPYNDRFPRLLEIAKKYEVDGILWYQTMYRDGADMAAWSFGHDFKDAGYSFVKIETDYNAAEKEQMRTRIETFVDLMSTANADVII